MVRSPAGPPVITSVFSQSPIFTGAVWAESKVLMNTKEPSKIVQRIAVSSLRAAIMPSSQGIGNDRHDDELGF